MSVLGTNLAVLLNNSPQPTVISATRVAGG